MDADFVIIVHAADLASELRVDDRQMMIRKKLCSQN